MGCGASTNSAQPRSSLHGNLGSEQEPTLRDLKDGTSRGYWERQKLVAAKWTVNSTMAIAKAALENGMPEPPESFFETQDRLVSFFEQHGQLKTYEPREVHAPDARPAFPAQSSPPTAPSTAARVGQPRSNRRRRPALTRALCCLSQQRL